METARRLGHLLLLLLVVLRSVGSQSTVKQTEEHCKFLHHPIGQGSGDCT
ncbi:hypothetical protein GDO81_021490 [Engystomops pustulosus]|uniref:Uncharacterized protein n=1 Tax=Engystomops pustulosus TaxID=76066 RepID=A0AAV6ZCC3_ENGPU|nr:hypothetical protein GDO81_021490 [Engystomops pustulosus]